jgi:hypothetical protein
MAGNGPKSTLGWRKMSLGSNGGADGIFTSKESLDEDGFSTKSLFYKV